MFDIGYEIIDFHTHPFTSDESNICNHKEACQLTVDDTFDIMRELNVSYFCGSVVSYGGLESLEAMRAKIVRDNNNALLLRDKYDGRFIPGIHVHPSLVFESCEDIERLSKKGVKLIGEIVPGIYGWDDYSLSGFSEILDCAEQYNMIVSVHTQNDDQMDIMVKNHPNLVIVAAHPGERGDFDRHMERAKLSENYYIDLSGYGMFRYGMLRHAIDKMGVDKIIFGSDYPTCAPGMYVGGVLFDRSVTDSEREKIFSLNAKRILGIK